MTDEDFKFCEGTVIRHKWALAEIDKEYFDEGKKMFIVYIFYCINCLKIRKVEKNV